MRTSPPLRLWNGFEKGSLPPDRRRITIGILTLRPPRKVLGSRLRSEIYGPIGPSHFQGCRVLNSLNECFGFHGIFPSSWVFFLNQGSTFTQHHHTQRMPRLSPTLSASICLALLGTSCGSESDLATSHQNPKLKTPPPAKVEPREPSKSRKSQVRAPFGRVSKPASGAQYLESFRGTISLSYWFLSLCLCRDCILTFPTPT